MSMKKENGPGPRSHAEGFSDVMREKVTCPSCGYVFSTSPPIPRLTQAARPVARTQDLDDEDDSSLVEDQYQGGPR